MRLLLAVDLNDHPEALVSEGVSWARRLGGTLDLLYVDEHSYNAYLVQDPAVRTVLEREWGKIREADEARLHALRQAIPEDHRGNTLIRTGRASDEIVDAAADHDAVLISTHGRRGVSHALLGSVAERVVRLAPMPVVVLKQPTLP